MTSPAHIRPLSHDDDLEHLTRLIHAAYAAHAARGLRFWGTHQTVADTRERFASGHGLVAEIDGEYAGTVTVRPPQPQSPVAWYRAPDTWSICQFAVAPAFKGRGLAKAMHEHALAHARRHGARLMALDTAAPAQALIAMYGSWGYRQVGEHSWQPHTNYNSVVMSRRLSDEAA